MRGSGREKKRDERLQKWARKNRGGNVCKEVGRRASNKITDYDINECRDGAQRVFKLINAAITIIFEGSPLPLPRGYERTA